MLKQRLLTALLLAASLLVVLLVLPRAVGVAVLAMLIVIGAWEWSAFLLTGRLVVRIGYVAVIAALMALAWYAGQDAAALQWMLAAAVVWWMIAFLWLTLAPGHVNAPVAALAGVCVLVPAWLALGRLHLDAAFGPAWVLALVLLVSLADVGAFFAGRRFGRLKLAPKVSPGKTWEGLLGGIVLAMLAAWLGVRWLDVPAVPYLALCVSVVLASVVGDLTESLFKRHAGLKDSGTLFPGHGGVLDRIDSLTAAAPLFMLGLVWLGSGS